MQRSSADIAIIGGGLAGCLIAWRLKQSRPDLSLALIEQGSMLGGDHTWSFHETDLSPQARRWTEPLLAHRWDSQEVRFPAYRRMLTTGYRAITSASLRDAVSTELADCVRLNTSVTRLAPHGLTFESGEEMAVRAVIDCRGVKRSPHLRLGWQKFLGRVVRFEAPHGLNAPIIMDACVDQLDGYRFVYVLPFDEHTALIEDTYYADEPGLDRAALTARVDAYAAAAGWQVAEVLREEAGVLPIALAGDIEALWDEGAADIARAGMRAGVFHPLTGYSFPDAAAVADLIADSDDLSARGLFRLTRDFAVGRWRTRGFYRLLSRMLFRAAAPHERYRVLERFYKMPQPLIERFYAGASPFRDKARILVGKPPVPIVKAIGCLTEQSVMRKS